MFDLVPDTSEPIALFKTWLSEARDAGLPLPESMALATVGPRGEPSVRMVLLKDCDETGFVFYTNLESRKAADLRANPRVGLCFHWREQGRQVRVGGVVERVSDAEADAYFANRPRESQLGAWASTQSAELEHRDALVTRFHELALQYEGRPIPRPPFWSGFRVKPAEIEFWQEMPHRLHDRVSFIKDASGRWTSRQLYP